MQTRLSPTSAFVTDLGRDYFLSGPSREYFSSLDLSEGQALIQDTEAAGILELSRELMCNRKFTVHAAAIHAIAEISATQVVILAAGLSPLGFDLLSAAPKARLWEIDTAGLEQKQNLLERFFPALNGRASFLTHDIRDPELLAKLEGFDAQAPTVLVMEGITHYLPPQELAAILKIFRREGKNRVVIEFAPPFEALADWVRPKAEACYRILEHRYHSVGMTKLSRAELGALVEGTGGKLLRHYRMDEMERMRTGQNAFFREPNSGWVEVVVAEI